MFHVKKIVLHAVVPKRATEGSAGLDISSSVDFLFNCDRDHDDGYDHDAGYDHDDEYGYDEAIFLLYRR